MRTSTATRARSTPTSPDAQRLGVDVVFAPTSRGDVSGRASRRSGVNPGAAGRDPGGREPARLLPRRAHRRAEAAAADPARLRVLRREGLPAAGAGPADGARPRRAGRGGRRADRAANRTGSRCPAATATCPRPAAMPRSRCPPRCGPERTRRPRASGPTRARRRHRGIQAYGRSRGRARELDYLVLTAPDLGDAPRTGPARLIVAAWIGRDTAAGVPGTRLIDNGPVELV